MIRIVAVTSLLLLASAGLGAQEAADTLWSKGLFQARATDILTAAKNSSFPGENDVVILYKQGRFRFTERGALERTTQLVYQILSEDGLKGWGGIQISWSPWHQDVPDVRVRVINSDGKDWYLDPRTMVEGNAGGESDNVYSDRKTLEAPFPQVHIGSIIEQQVVSVSRPILEGGGFIQNWDFYSRTPIMVNRLIIEAPASLTVKQKGLGQDVPSPQSSSAAGASRWEYVRTRQFPGDTTERGLPRDVPSGPFVCFSTAPPWNVLAAGYSRLVDQKISAQKVDIPKESIVAGDPVKTSIKLMRWINTRVRYVGLELGSNSIVPYTPREILDRGYGDCKDKATLLASFLRQAGYKACLALLWNDSEEDILPDMPGMDIFNHAIVYVDGPQPLWLDPTSDFSVDDRLPYWDQERWALPARPETTGLVKTASYPAAYQDTTQSNDYYLQDTGNCNVTETVAYSGGLDLYHRSSHAYGDPAEIKKDLESYVERYYSQKKLESFAYSDAHDLDTPFTLTLRVNDTPIGATYTEYAEVAIKTDELFGWLPSALLDKKAAPRKQDFRLSLPFIIHWENRIHPPSGFIPRGLPDPVQKDMGSVSYRSNAERLPDGTVVVHMSIETKKGRLGPAEFDATRKAVIDYQDTLGTITIVLDHEAEQLYSAGEYLQAFRKFRELIAREPAKSVHEIRLSKALLKSGLGDEAASAARRAVDLAPADSEAWVNLAWILQHDQIGQRFGPGYDRGAALAAYRKSLELAPDVWYARADYAILLEYDKNGIRYADKTGLAQSVEQYALVKDSLKEHNLELNPVAALWYLGRLGDVESMAKSLGNADDRETYQLAARSARGGTAAAVRAMNAQLSREKRQDYQARAAGMLSTVRAYKEASELYRMAARGSSNAVNLDYQADLMASTRRFDPETGQPADPTALVNAWYCRLAAADGTDFLRLKPLLAGGFFEVLQQKNQGLSLKSEWDSLARVVRGQNSSMESLMDMVLSHCAYDVKGTDLTGYHVVVRSTLAQDSILNTFFMIREEGTLKIAALFGTPASVPIALRALSARKDWASAAAWLDWIRTDAERVHDADLDGFKEFWPGGSRRGPADIQPAVDFLSALFARQSGDIEPAWKHVAELKGDARARLLAAIIEGCRNTSDWPGMLSAAGELMQMDPAKTEYLRAYIDALYRTHNWERMEMVLNEQVKNPAQREYAQTMLLSLAIARRDSARIQGLLKEPAVHLSAYDYNKLAWLALFQPDIGDQALEYARKAVTMSNSQERSILHTMASLYAQTGRYEDARKLMQKCLEMGGDATPNNEDWFVFGRIAEGYGFLQSARQSYEKVEKPVDGEPNSTWELARRRLAVLGN